jgi:hypothetical protein
MAYLSARTAFPLPYYIGRSCARDRRRRQELGKLLRSRSKAKLTLIATDVCVCVCVCVCLCASRGGSRLPEGTARVSSVSSRSQSHTYISCEDALRHLNLSDSGPLKVFFF